MPGPNQGTIPNIRFSLLNFHHYVEGPPPTSGPHGSGQFQAPVVQLQVPFQPPQMGVGGSPGPYMSVISANIHQMGQQMGQDLENQVKSTISQAQSMMAAAMNGGNYPQAANSSSSRNVEGSDSMHTDIANLSLNDSQPQIPIHLSPPTSDRQIGLNPADQMGSSTPSTSYLRPYYNAVEQGSHVNPTLAPHMNESDMVKYLTFQTETLPYGNNSNRPPPPASVWTSPFNYSPSFSVGPNSNAIIQGGHSVHRTNIDFFNGNNDTVRDSFNDNSLVDTTERHSGNVLFHDVPIVNWLLMILSIQPLKVTGNKRFLTHTCQKGKERKRTAG